MSTKVVLFSLLRVIYVGRPQTSSRASLAGHVKTRIAGPTPWTSNLGSAVGLVLGHPPCELLRAAPCSAAFLRGSLLSSGMQWAPPCEVSGWGWNKAPSSCISWRVMQLASWWGLEKLLSSSYRSRMTSPVLGFPLPSFLGAQICGVSLGRGKVVTGLQVPLL